MCPFDDVDPLAWHGLIERGRERGSVHAEQVTTVLRDIEQPSFAINPDHLAHTVQLDDGRVLTGILRHRNDQTQLIDMLLRTGRHGVWLPENRVIHHTDRKRLRASYLRRFYYQVGWLLAQAEAETVDGASRMRDVVDRIARYRRFDLRWRQPLAERLAALRDRAIDLGYRDGFREARRLNRPGVRKRIAGARHA